VKNVEIETILPADQIFNPSRKLKLISFVEIAKSIPSIKRGNSLILPMPMAQQ